MKTAKTTTHNVHEARTHLSKLLERVAAGEDVIIAQANAAVARLMPVGPLGAEKGRLGIAEDFDAPLPGEILNTFDS